MEESNSLKNNTIYTFDPFRLNVGERRLSRDGKAIPLARKAFDLLLLLVESAGHLKTREELIEALWPHNIVEEQGLTTKLYTLRKTLGDDGEAPRYIETVRGVGYRFIAPVTIEKPSEPVNPRDPAKGQSAPAPHRPFYRDIRLLAPAALVIIAAVLVWRLVPWGAASSHAGESLPSIAVLPFENLSTDKSNAYFAAGIRDTILTRLAELGGLRVISRSVSDTYAASPSNLGRVGRELDVGSVLEGSVQKAGKQVLINVQLINTRTHAHVWAATYTRTLADIFKVEGEVATQVAAALRTRLRPAERAKLMNAPTRDPEAYLLYLKANYNARRIFDLANAPDPQTTVKRATSLYKQALARDPEFALAWARLSLLDSKAWWFGLDSTPARRAAAMQAAKRAIALAPALPQAHIALGYAWYYGAGNYARALHQFRIARETLPHDAEVIGAMAYVQRRQGHWQTALADFSQAIRLDPRNPRWRDETGITLMALRRYAEAEREFNQVLAIAPDDYDARTRRINLALLSGNTARARHELASIAADTDPQGLISALRFELAWLTRKPDDALAVLDNTRNWKPDNPLRADVWALKGDKARARRLYEKTRTRLRAALRKEPDNAGLWSALGLAEAGLGNRTAALEAGRHATRLYPVSKDRMSGPLYLAALARIHVRLGESAQAIKLIRELLAMPAGLDLSVPLLRLDPDWDSIRNDPAFQALLKKYGSKSPAPITAVKPSSPLSH